MHFIILFIIVLLVLIYQGYTCNVLRVKTLTSALPTRLLAYKAKIKLTASLSAETEIQQKTNNNPLLINVPFSVTLINILKPLYNSLGFQIHRVQIKENDLDKAKFTSLTMAA